MQKIKVSVDARAEEVDTDQTSVPDYLHNRASVLRTEIVLDISNMKRVNTGN